MVAEEPTNQVGNRLPIRLTVVSIPDASVALLEVTVYTTGVVFEIGVRSRGREGLDGSPTWPLPDITFEGIDAKPRVVGRGGGGGIGDDGLRSQLDTFRYWLPPPAGPFRIKVEWPHFSLSGSTEYFEAEPFKRAAASVLILWQP